MIGSERGRARAVGPRRWRRLVLERLEERALLASPPFAVGGDPSVHPADFRITTFASGLNYPHGMTTLPDGSLLVAVNNPVQGKSFYNTVGQLLRFTDANGDSVADGPGQVLFDNLPGGMTALHQAGQFILATSSAGGSEQIAVLRTGATPGTALTAMGSIRFSFPNPSWEHTTFASAVRPTPGQPGDYDVVFNVGSEFNGVVIGGNGQVVLDQNGNPTYQPTTGTVGVSGLVSGTLQGDSLYLVTLHDNSGTPVFSSPTLIALGLRNAASLAFDPGSGDLYLADNGIDGNSGGDEAWSTDELNRIPAAQIGSSVPFFGFPTVILGSLKYSYVKTIDKPGDPVTVVNPEVGTQPLVAFQPLSDPALPDTGSQSEGSSGFALSPPRFPAGLNRGVFIGFHGRFNLGGTANEENPLVYADPSTGRDFDFISNEELNIGHLDEVLSTADSLFLADIASGGNMGTGAGQGVIYQIKAIASGATNHSPVLAAIPDQTVDEGTPVIVTATATDPDPGQAITYSLGPNAPPGAVVDRHTGAFTWTPDPYAGSGNYAIQIIATDNGSPPMSDSRTFSVHVLPVNHPPNLLSIPAQLVERGGTGIQVRVRDYVSDPDKPAQTLQYNLAEGAPTGATIDRDTGVFTWTPPADQPAMEYSIGVSVTDSGSPRLSATKSFTVRVVPFNHPPVVSTIPEQSVDEGVFWTVTATATDSEVPAQAITYTLGSDAPAGVSIDARTGVLTWTPDPYAGSGTYSITVFATDNGAIQKSGSATFTVLVRPVNHPPVLASIPPQTVTPGGTVQLGLSTFVTDPDRPVQVLQYRLAPDSPDGARIDPASGLFLWTAPSSQHIGTYSFSVLVTDSGSPQLSQVATLTVNVVDIGPATIITRAKVRNRRELTITLTFSQPLDASSARDPDNYVLAPARPGKKAKAKANPAARVPLRVSYDPAANTVTLTADTRVKFKPALRLTVMGTGPLGIAKVTDLPLAGNRVQPGTNYVATVTARSIRQTNVAARRAVALGATAARLSPAPRPAGPPVLPRDHLKYR